MFFFFSRKDKHSRLKVNWVDIVRVKEAHKMNKKGGQKSRDKMERKRIKRTILSC